MTISDERSAAPEREASASADKPSVRRTGPRVSASVLSLLGFIVILAAVFGLTTPGFFTVNNALIILSSSAVIGIVSLGQTAAIITGGFDLSISGLIPLGAIVFATALNAGAAFIVALLITLVAGLVFGLFNGFLITRLKINPLITTLGTLSISVGVAQLIADGITVPFTDPTINILAARSIGGIANGVWFLIVLAVLFGLMLKYTTFGRSLYAIGGNTEASWLAGIRVERTLTTVYALSGVLASFAGAMLASQLLAGTTNLGATAALTAVTAVVLGGGVLSGGSGSVLGTMLGVVILGMFQNGLTIKQIDPFYQQIATGAVLLIAVGISQLRQGRARSWFASRSRAR
ncbi:hypothetical protein ASD65_08580 [Microbacterium sp. Root61]|uniref:ABC transporter permease n=1 Tax=Microbacterium sp. Root61 TaxID=1736570 RepID=UPI0006F948ED|nr:ABC transporter permease [Microbacterium sp. Root61]KRA24471.1 hypothetical protein ASD65_08580 [Microbacterium sp. Root61]